MPAPFLPRIISALSLILATAPLNAEPKDTLRILAWEWGPNLNPYLAAQQATARASSLVLEPLVGYSPDGKLQLKLADRLPTVANGDVDPDLMHITWTLKPDLLWSDGTPVTTTDVAFTARYCMQLKDRCAAWDRFRHVDRVEILDPRRIRLRFKQRQPNPYRAFVSAQSPVLQRKQFEYCVSSDATSCLVEFNRPIGTGPYKVVQFTAGADALFETNPHFRLPLSPSMAKVIYTSGTDPVTAAHSVLLDGTYDATFQVQTPPQALADLEAQSDGRVMRTRSGYQIRLGFNMANPPLDWPDSDYANPPAPHPVLTDIRIREALVLALPKFTQDDARRHSGALTCSLLPVEPLQATCPPRDTDRARMVLDRAGWQPGPDGVRVKDGQPLTLQIVTTTNALHDRLASQIAAAWGDIGVATTRRVFFSNMNVPPVEFLHTFVGDVIIFVDGGAVPDAEELLLKRRCDQHPIRKSPFEYVGDNILRYCDPKFDRLFKHLTKSAERQSRADLARKLDRMLIEGFVEIPMFRLTSQMAIGPEIRFARPNPWDTDLSNIHHWAKIGRD